MNMLFKMETGIVDSNEEVKMEEKIVVPANQVYDNVGHGNPGKTFNGWIQGVGGQINIAQPYNIYIDTTSPITGYYYVTNFGGYKAGQEVKGSFGFSEEIRPGTIKYKFGDNGTVTKATYSEKNYIGFNEKIEFSAIVNAGENGAMQMYLDNFTDLAGNELVNSDSYYQGASYGLYADTTSPTIELTNNNLEPGVTEYTFNLKDNSEEYRYSTYQGGLASNTFTLDDIGVFNGTILGSTIDERGNVKTIKVLSSSDG